MNSWSISGEILKYGTKGSEQYPKLWVYVLLSTPKDSKLQENRVFLNFDIDTNTTTKKGRIGASIKDSLTKNRFIFVSDNMITLMNTSKKVGDDWVKEEVVGIKGKIENIVLSNNRFDDMNIGLVKGPVQKYYHDQENNIIKMVIEEKYRNPKTNEWKSRTIPVMGLASNNEVDLTGKTIFVHGALCGCTPDGGSKTFGWIKKLIVNQ